MSEYRSNRDAKRALPRRQQHVGDMPTREIHDAEGRSWVLGVVPSIGLDGTVEMALVAEDGDLMRRFAAYPANWYSLAEEELLRIVQGPNRLPQRASNQAQDHAQDHAQDQQHHVEQSHGNRRS